MFGYLLSQKTLKLFSGFNSASYEKRRSSDTITSTVANLFYYYLLLPLGTASDFILLNDATFSTTALFLARLYLYSKVFGADWLAVSTVTRPMKYGRCGGRFAWQQVCWVFRGGLSVEDLWREDPWRSATDVGDGGGGMARGGGLGNGA